MGISGIILSSFLVKCEIKLSSEKKTRSNANIAQGIYKLTQGTLEIQIES